MVEATKSSNEAKFTRSAKRIALGALLTLAIAILGILPPLLHFITGPLGPLIGGLFSGYRMQARLAEAAGMGLVVGFIILVPGALIVSMLGDAPGSGNTQVVILLGVAAYFGLMTMLGALAGGALAPKRVASEASIEKSLPQ